MKLYNVVQQEDGTAKVETELDAEEMNILLTLGIISCLQRGMMVKSLAHHFGQLPPDENTQPNNEVQKEEETTDWEALLEKTN